jgi:peptidyl-prolyl cis-trans isomerase D
VLPEQLSLQYLLLSTEEANKKVTITEEELKQFYEENKSAFSSVKDAKAKTPDTFATSKPAVEKALRAQKAEQWVATQSDKLANLTYTRPDTLKAASDALSLPIQTTAFFTQRGEKQGLLSNPKVLAAAFSDNVLKQRNNSDVIQLDDRTVMVLRIAEYKPATPQPLAEVRQKIEKFLKQQAAQKAAATLGQQIQEQLKKGVSTSQLAAKNNLSWVQKQDVVRTAKDIPKEILNLVFDRPAPESSEKPVIDGKSLPDGSYAVVALNAVVAGNSALSDAAARSTLQKQMDNQFGALDYDLYLAQQMGEAKIKIEETSR